MLYSCLWIVIITVFILSSHTEGTCTFPTELEGDWYSAHKGKLTFNSTYLKGYPIYMSFAVQSLDFECYEQSDRKYLLRATELALVFGQYIRGYLCIELWRVSATKYYYYLGTSISFTNNDNIFGRIDAIAVDTSSACNMPEPYNTGSFVILVRNAVDTTNYDNIKGFIDSVINGTLDNTCDIEEPYNSTAYIMLVKNGSVSTGESEATCAQDLLASYSAVTITDSTSTTSCSNSLMDGCTDPTEMRFTYDAGCANTHKFSTDGGWTCMRSVTSGSYTYLSVWNNDSSIVGTTSYSYTSGANYQFACLVIDGSSASMFPNFCSDSSQTPATVGNPGLLLTFSSATSTCYESVEGGSSIIYYIVMILGSLFIIALIGLIVFLCKKGYCNLDRCKKRPATPTESTVEQGEHVNNTVFKVSKLQPIPGFKAKRPLRIGPIVEPNLDPLPKVEPLYAFFDRLEKKDTSKPKRREDDVVSVDSMDMDGDNPFTIYNIARLAMLPPITAKKSFDINALTDPKRNTLHDIMEVKKKKIEAEKIAEKKGAKNEETKKEATKTETQKQTKYEKEKPRRLSKQMSKESKPSNSKRRPSKK